MRSPTPLSLRRYCFEAFDKLTSHHMLDSAAERELLASLPFDEQCGDDAATVRYLYSTKMKKYADESDADKEGVAADPTVASNPEVRVNT